MRAVDLSDHGVTAPALSNTTGDAWSAAGDYTLRKNETDNSAERTATEA